MSGVTVFLDPVSATFAVNAFSMRLLLEPRHIQYRYLIKNQYTILLAFYNVLRKQYFNRALNLMQGRMFK